MKNHFPEWNPPHGPYPTRAHRKRMAQTNWYVRAAERLSVVPAPEASFGVPQIMVAMMPDVFTSDQQARRYADRRPIEIVLDHWGDDVVEVQVRIPRSIWVPMLVNAKNRSSAERILRFALPKGTEMDFGGT